MLERMLQHQVQVITGDGRVFIGTLEGIDQTMNTVLSSTMERVFTKDAPSSTLDLGLFMIRGEMIVAIGELEHNAAEELAKPITAEPFAPIRNY